MKIGLSALFLCSCALQPFSVALNGSCENTKQCQPGALCIEKACTQACNTNVDCGAGSLCLGDGKCQEASAELISQSPTLTAIEGDGTSADRFASGLLLRGTHLDRITTVRLLTEALEPFAELLVSRADATSISAALPLSITPGTYTVQILGDAGATRQDVTLLKGESGTAGSTGPVGPTGASGEALNAEGLAQLDLRYAKLGTTPKTLVINAVEFVRLGVTAPALQFDTDYRVKLPVSGVMAARIRLPFGTLINSISCHVVPASAIVTWIRTRDSQMPTECGKQTTASVGSRYIVTSDGICDGLIGETQGDFVQVKNTAVGDAADIDVCYVNYTLQN